MKLVIARFHLVIWMTFLMLATSATSSAQIFGYVTDNMDRTVSVVDTSSDTVVATIDVGVPYPYGVACHPDGTKVYVSGTGVANAGTVFLIDVATQTLVKPVAVGKTARGLAVLPDGSAEIRSCSRRIFQPIDLRWSEDFGKPFAEGGPCLVAEVAGVHVPVLMRQIVVADKLGGTAGNERSDDGV